MRAALYDRYGPPDVLYVGERPRPVPGPNDVLVEVYAAAVNPIDYKLRSGHQRGLIRLDFPHVPGMDVSGVVAEVGAKVTAFAPGDRVFSSPTHRRPGTTAEYVCIDARAVARVPERLTHAQAASLPLVALTAWRALVSRAGLKAGETVFIQAGAGGVGTFAIQLARHIGARVITTCSPRNNALVESLGADEIIDYRTVQYDAVLSDIDVVLDALGGEHKLRSLGILRRGGRLMTLNTDLPALREHHGPTVGVLRMLARMAWLKARCRLTRNVDLHHVLRPSDGAMLGEIAAVVQSGAIEPIIDRVVPLDDIAEAHRYIETGRARGKIVIEVRPESTATG